MFGNLFFLTNLSSLCYFLNFLFSYENELKKKRAHTTSECRPDITKDVQQKKKKERKKSSLNVTE